MVQANSVKVKRNELKIKRVDAKATQSVCTVYRRTCDARPLMICSLSGR